MATSFNDSTETTQLLHEAAAGDVLAIERLFARHLTHVKASVRRRLRRRLRPRFDPSDVIQETHQLAWRQLRDYLERRPMPFGLWLLKTAHQRLADLERTHLIAARRSVGRELSFPGESSPELALQAVALSQLPGHEAVRREQAQIVRHCLAGLPDHDREILLLRVFDGLRNSEVASLLELSNETTKKRFTRALLRLRHLLREAGLGQ